jgi:hypothetical protein
VEGRFHMINGSIISLGYALCANHKYNKNKKLHKVTHSIVCDGSG